MELPSNIQLPFFAYGIFKERQISYFCIKEYVESTREHASIKGKLLVRDGIPLVDEQQKDNQVNGSLITFKQGDEQTAYTQICNLEPQKYYRWDVLETNFGKANVLVGKSTSKGTAPADEYEWDSWADPLFTTSFEIIDETIAKEESSIDGKEFLKLQMAYLLLWTAIERFVTLRHNFRGTDEVMQKIMKLANNNTFQKKLMEIEAIHRDIYSTDNVEKKIKFEVRNPKLCLDYYYQVRCNITHRGKAAIADAKLVRQCLVELANLFKSVIEEAKRV